MPINYRKISQNKYQLEKIPGIETEAVFYAKESMLSAISQDRSLEQLQNTASLPDLVSPVIAMPDMHEGYGVPIGGVVATNNLISVGAVGMDINCGVRLLTSPLEYEEAKFSTTRFHQIINQIEHLIPVGLGGRHKKNVISFDMKEITTQGVPYLAKKGYASQEDIDQTEEYGCLKGSGYPKLSQKAVQRASKQLGTLGSGNHFIEIQKIDEVFDENLARKWHLFKNQLCIMIHSGSRALGHQTCIDYLNIFARKAQEYGIKIPNRELTSLPLTTKEGQDYFAAMKACVNFAFCNRQLMTYFVRKIFEKNFKAKLSLLYDVAHNIGKHEEHNGQKVLIHRKGATRALPAKHPQNPQTYLETGHPAIIPGSMGTASYVLVGLPKNAETYHSVNHGSGRRMSRTQARKSIKKEEFETVMRKIVYNRPFRVISDEAPQAYKNIEEVVDTLTEINLTKKVVKLAPLAVIKGS